MKLLENRLILLFFFVVLILIVVYLIYNQKLGKQLFNLNTLKKKLVEGFDTSGNSGELITNGNFSNGQNIDQFSIDNGINEIKKVNNPGSSDYVLMQKQTGYNTFYKIMVTPEQNQTYLLTLWVRFDNPKSSTIDLGELVKINTQNNNSINDILSITYTIQDKITLPNNKVWYKVAYNFTTSNDTMPIMNVYLNYTTSLQAQYIFFADISLTKVISGLPNYNIVNGLKVFLSGLDYNTSTMGKKWSNLVDTDDFFSWTNIPMASDTGGYLSTANNNLSYTNPLTIMETDGTATFSISLVFNKDIESGTVMVQGNTESESGEEEGGEEEVSTEMLNNVLSISGNDGKSLELFLPDQEGKIKVVYNGMDESYSSRELVFYNKTILTLTYSDSVVNVYQDGVQVLTMTTGVVHLDNEPLIINKNGTWDANLYDVIIYNRVLSGDEMNTMNDYFYNEAENASTFVSNGESIIDSDGLFTLDMDNSNLVGIGEEVSEEDYQRGVCYNDCNNLCQKLMNTSSLMDTGIDDFNKCRRSCKNVVKSCQTFCSNSPDDTLCELSNCSTDGNTEYLQSDCPVAYKKNGRYIVYIKKDSLYSNQLGYSGERDYGDDRDVAYALYQQNFPKCEMPDVLKVGGGKNLMETCPFLVTENNPCYTSSCANIDWSDESNLGNIPNNCKISVNSYCQANRDLDSNCACWKEKNMNNSTCANFRRKFSVSGVNTGNAGDFPITSHPDFGRYIRKDNIPCWNCNIPSS